MEPERVYIAGPYQPKDCTLHAASQIAQRNVDHAVEAGNRLIEQGHYVFIPHLSHYVHTHYSCKRDYFVWWYREDLTFLKHWATVVYMLKGWTFSSGAVREFDRAKELGLKVWFEEKEVIRD